MMIIVGLADDDDCGGLQMMMICGGLPIMMIVEVCGSR